MTYAEIKAREVCERLEALRSPTASRAVVVESVIRQVLFDASRRVVRGRSGVALEAAPARVLALADRPVPSPLLEPKP